MVATVIDVDARPKSREIDGTAVNSTVLSICSMNIVAATMMADARLQWGAAAEVTG